MMPSVRWWWWSALTLVAWCAVHGSAGRAPGGSLRSALEALQRRQRAQGGVPHADYRDEDVYDEQTPQQLYEYYGVSAPGVAPPLDEDSEIPDAAFGKYVIAYLGGDEPAADFPTNYKVKKRVMKVLKEHGLPPVDNKRTSAFRERGKHENDRLRELFMSDLNNDKQDREQSQEAQFQSDEEYAELLQELWEKYKMTHSPIVVESPADEVGRMYRGRNIRKRQIPGDYFPSAGWGPIAFKKKRSADDRIEDEAYPAENYGFPFKYQNYPNIENEENVGEPELGDSNDMRDEYTIAFEPLDDEKIRDVGIGNGFYQYKSKKAIPLSKRSSGSADPSTFKRMRRLMHTANQSKTKQIHGGMGTDPKVMRDLSNIFGNTPDDFDQIIRKPVKRSGSSDDTSHESKSPQITAKSHNNTPHEHNSSLAHEDVSHEKQSQSSVISHPNLSKKDSSTTKQNGDETERPINIKKKSINWSEYFGFDRKKKQAPSYMIPNTEDYLRKQYINSFKQRMNFPSGEYTHMYHKRNFFNDRPIEEGDFKFDKASAVEIHKKKSAEGPSHTGSQDTGLDSIEYKLKNMEGDIVDDALKHSGIPDISDVTDTNEEREEKERMLTRLAAAYTLEKMRKALEDVKDSLITHKQVEESKQIQSDTKSNGGEKDKRIAIKKEKAVLPEILKHEEFEKEQGAGQFINGADEEDLRVAKQHAANVFAGKESSDCPLLEAMLLRCRQVDRYSGVFGTKFVPLCSIHLICYVCSESSKKMCDEVFLNESSMICEGDPSCRAASMDALAAVRELRAEHARELGAECEACVRESLDQSPSLWTAYNLMW